MSSDEEILKRFVAGDRAALGELAGRYEVALLNLALPMLGSRELAMDAVQETWLRVIRYAASFNGRSTLKTWLYRIAINQCRTALATSPPSQGVGRGGPEDEEQGQREAPPLQGGERGGPENNVASVTQGSSPVEPEARARVSSRGSTRGENDPSAQAVTREQNDSLKDAVAQLPPDHREVILLCYTQGLTHAAKDAPTPTVQPTGFGAEAAAQFKYAWRAGLQALVTSSAAILQVIVGGLVFWIALVILLIVLRRWYLRRTNAPR